MHYNKTKHLMDRYYINFHIKKIKINNILNKGDEYDYKKFVNLLFSYDLIKSFNYICNILERYIDNKVDIFNFVYSFILYKYHFFILSDESEDINVYTSIELKNNLIDSSIKLVNYMCSFDVYDDFCIFKLLNRYNRFNSSLKEWQNSDKIKIIKLLSESYYNLENLKYDILYTFDESSDIELEIIKNKQNDIVKELLYYDDVNIYKTIKPSISNVISNTDNDDYYWKLLYEELSLIPIEYSSVIKRLIEIKNTIYNIIPKNKTLIKEMECILFINSIFDKNIDSNYILTSTNYLFSLLKKINNNHNIICDSYHKILRTSMINGNELRNFIPECLKFLVYIYYKIWDDKVHKKLV